ncbi:hypothetical protein AHAT_30460 [Agarivorans sp. Toyoura001]|uniref:efflux RND transporter periplasmic adaptor subunit n=1 Tax=Agarivorans sp. Toyoura001 TaxID=2283141 RepID=UPI0010E05B69|nr:efflux RND transporter periplasmic adaptor subunit [Agarivorans sp. Toyoura001]GDY27156.1 hypothetical protein AHAT_30460 [Agarivorans sp. Toyoura001]
MNKLLVLLPIYLLSSLALANDYVVGTLIPAKSVIVRSELSGVVDSYHVDNGDTVSREQPLLALSTADYTLNVALAKYQLDVSDAELKAQEKQLVRYQSLFKTQGVSASVLDDQLRVTGIGRAQFKVSETQYKIAQRTLSKSTPTSPFDGVVISRHVELGQFISVGDPLYTVADIDRLKVRFYLLELDFFKFSKGDRVKVGIPSINQSFDAEVSFTSPALQGSEPGFLIEVVLDNHNAQLHSGMTSHIYFNEESEE